MATVKKAKSTATKGTARLSTTTKYMALYVNKIRSGLNENILRPKTICNQPECYELIQQLGGEFGFKIVDTAAAAQKAIDDANTGIGFVIKIEKNN